MKKELEGKYIVVTAISSFKMKYVIPTEELQKLNPEIDLDDAAARGWAEDCVIMEEVKDFSQKHIGETVIETDILDEDTLLKVFDRENDYLSEWTREKKINYARNWKDEYTKKKKDEAK